MFPFFNSGHFENEYPYTDFHELNLDFVLDSIVEIKEKIGDEALTTVAQTLTGAINELKSRIDTLDTWKGTIDTWKSGIDTWKGTIDSWKTSISSTVAALQSGKQDKLTAGTNITIDANNVISASGGGGSITEQKITINETVDGNACTFEITRYGNMITILSLYQLPSQSAKYQYQAYMTNTLPSWALPTSTDVPNDRIILRGYSGAMNTGTVTSTDIFIPNAYTVFSFNTETGQIAINVAKCESTVAPTGALRDCYGSVTYRL